MIGYVMIGTNDLERGAKFYDALLGTLGAKRVLEDDNFIAWGTGGLAGPALSITKPENGKAATVGNGTMVALAMESKEAVDALHAKAMELGASDEGAPGPRSETFYAGYFRDLDGNKLNAFFMG